MSKSLLKRKGVLLVSNMFPSKKYPFFGTFVESFYLGLSERGINFVGLAVINKISNDIVSKAFSYFRLFSKILFFSATKSYRVLYIHYAGFHALFCLLVWFLMPGVKLVLNFHGSDLLGRSSEVKPVWWKLKLMKIASLIVLPSNYFKEKLLQKHPFLLEKVYVSPSGGVDTSLFFPPSTSELNMGVVKIGFVGRIIEGKGWRNLLKAFSFVCAERHDVELHIAGDGSELYLMKEAISKLNLSKRVYVYGGISHSEVGVFLRKQDVFIFPTLYYESLGLVALEAMACGLPVIASKRGGIKDYLVEGINGFGFDPDSVQSLVNVILIFLNLNAEDRMLLTSSALATAKNYDSNLVLDNLNAKIQDLFNINVR